jgi:hypothetical protein
MTFKQFLNEKPTYHRKIAMQMAFGALPVTDKVAYHLGFGDLTQTFHATDLDHLKNLKKTGRSKKTISTFTRGLNKLIDGGMAINPDVIAKLEGTAMMEFQGDAYSHPDPQGRRWIITSGSSKSNFLKDALMTKPIAKMWEFLDDDIVKYDLDKTINTYDEFFYLVRKDEDIFQRVFNDYLSGKEKSKVIALYITNAENLMSNTMYSKIVNELLTIDDSGFDEIIMNKFKVLGVYSIENRRFAHNHENAQSIIEEMGYKYLGHIPKDKFSKVTPETY